MPVSPAQIVDNLARVRQRIGEAAIRAGRDPSSVRLVAVTKYVGIEEIAALLAAGCHDLGESKPQDLWEKAAQFSADATSEEVRWHFVGHLQRNKLRRTWPLACLLHSGDSLRLLSALDREAAEAPRKPRVLIEVNVSGDANKHGFAPREVPAAIDSFAALDNVEFCGLMAMAGQQASPAETQKQFAVVRQLRDELQTQSSGRLSLPELSMGMSDDYEIAIAEGATLVRVGSALFAENSP